MEQPQQLNEDTNNGGSKAGGAGGGAGGGSGFICRQSSTRWTPTTDQIRILKDLYYNYGVRSPSADQIQRISARLRQYGKIEGKNVFYWFQNHKARERQKKRFVPDHHPNPNPNPNSIHHFPAASLRPSAERKPGEVLVHGNKYSGLGTATGLPSSSSAATPGVVAFGQMANYGYGSTATMENNFRNCSISAGCGGGGSLGVGGSAMSHNFGWITVDSYPYSSRSIFDKQGYNINEEQDDREEEEDEQGNSAREIETLPLFPMHDNINGFCGIKHNEDGGPAGIWYDRDVFMGSSRTSLDLSLNSYTMSPGSP